MKNKRCIAFRQSVDYPELMMPCTGIANSRGRGQVYDMRTEQGYFCAKHARAYRELLVGILNETRERRVEKE